MSRLWLAAYFLNAIFKATSTAVDLHVRMHAGVAYAWMSSTLAALACVMSMASR